jgi:EAL domain-containing protein (putative c-di-GMP-specific phosphodiesterase class I)/ActR/RegA family two-component response regulator
MLTGSPLNPETGPSAAVDVDAVPTDATSQLRMRPSILLLDDDPLMLDLQARLLGSMGYQEVSTADSAEAAQLQLARAPQSADVVICDLNMPGVDGLQFLHNLNASPFRGSIILLSGEGVRILHAVQKLLSGGRLVILGALEKPAKRSALGALLGHWKQPAASAPVRRAPTFTAADLLSANWVLQYQPKVDLRTGALAGVEALVRWDHPQHGLLFPDTFIGAAEDCGAIDGLTDWVLRESMNQMARWRGEGLRVQMAVNVSMENLRSPGFAERVGDLVRGIPASPQEVTLEITESRLMSPSPAPLENLVRLRLKRFGLSIDDFGTGHSSLAQLRDVPFTELKVDRSFVQGARHNQIIRPILAGSVGLARRLGMQSVAEGVETEDDWRLLREIGCDLAQGYFIGRPMFSSRMQEWVEDWQARRAPLVAP